MLLLVATAGSAAAQGKPSCITTCDDPKLTAACEEFRACQELFRDEVSTCVEEHCQCTEEAPHCRFPITPGRCTITLECVGKCYRDTHRLDEVPSSTDCIRDLKAALRGPDGGCRVSSAAARHACNRCVGRLARACTPAFDERPSQCQQQCVRRILEKQATSKDCYSKCGDRCDGDSCATAMCQRACRNSACNALLERCSPELHDDDPDDADEGEQHRLNVGYRACCQKDLGECDTDDDATILCTPTTTSSTSTTSSSSTSVSSVSTVTSSTTSTSL